MADTDKSGYGKARVVDLSTCESRKSRKTIKGVAPVVQQTINLSTPKQEAPESSADAGATDRPTPVRERGKASRGNSLAELLDEETLAKLRGEP